MKEAQTSRPIAWRAHECVRRRPRMAHTRTHLLQLKRSELVLVLTHDLLSVSLLLLRLCDAALVRLGGLGGRRVPLNGSHPARQVADGALQVPLLGLAERGHLGGGDAHVSDLGRVVARLKHHVQVIDDAAGLLERRRRRRGGHAHRHGCGTQRMHRRVRAPRGRSRSGGGSGGGERECGGACSARSRPPAGAARAQCGAPPHPHLGARARLTTTRAPTHPPRTFASLPRVRASASTSRFPLLARAMRRIRIPPRRPRPPLHQTAGARQSSNARRTGANGQKKKFARALAF